MRTSSEPVSCGMLATPAPRAQTACHVVIGALTLKQ